MAPVNNCSLSDANNAMYRTLKHTSKASELIITLICVDMKYVKSLSDASNN